MGFKILLIDEKLTVIHVFTFNFTFLKGGNPEQNKLTIPYNSHH